MKIVIISRIMYPSLSPRAFRTTELAKEMAKRGHDVTIYAVLGKYDYSQFTQKTGVKVCPIRMFLSTADSDGVCRYNFVDKMMYHSFHHLLEYPDIEFVWKIPSILAQENGVDLLVTIAYPHPIHWGAAVAKKKLGNRFPQKWISDCGDPYMGNSVSSPPLYMRVVEDFWVRETDFITIPIEEGRVAYSKQAQEKIHIIPQGFNFGDTPTISPFIPNEVVHFAYAGSIYPKYRDPSQFLAYLQSVPVNFVFTVYTNSPLFYEPYKQQLGRKLDIRPYVKREQLIYELSQQDFLINIRNAQAVQAPSKLIDYMLTHRPILEISSEFSEEETFQAFLKRDYTRRLPNVDISQYDIRNVVDKFLSL